MTRSFLAPSHPELLLLEQYRQQFPALTDKTYFNYGGQGPMPQGALTAIHQAHDYLQRSGPFSSEVNRWIIQEENRTKETIAAELGVTAATISLTENVTVGCNIALWGMEWRSGDHILLSDCEHPGIVAAVKEIQYRFGIEVTTCPLMATINGGDPTEVIRAHLRPTTRLVVLSHILWNTGRILPLKEISQVCHAYPAHQTIRVLVDAAQSVGVLPLKLGELEVDFYAFTGHKWWCGPAGLGGLYVSPEALDSLRPTFIGWRSITKDASGSPTGYQPNGQRYEVATSDYALYSSLRAAIAAHHGQGSIEERFQRIRSLSQYLWQRLSDLPEVIRLQASPADAGLIPFQLRNGQHSQLVQFLERQGFLLRTLLDPDCIRACVHYFTLESEIDRLIEAMQRFE